MRTRLGIIAIAAALTLTACGSSGSTDSTPSDTAAATETSAPATSADFGAPLDLGNGVSVTVSKPASFKPGDFASNYLPGQVANLFTVDVKNGGKAAFDMSTILFSATTGGNFCADVLDGDNGINGAPTEPVPAGGSVSFKYAIGCDAKVGDPVELSVAIGDTSVGLKGNLA